MSYLTLGKGNKNRRCGDIHLIWGHFVHSKSKSVGGVARLSNMTFEEPGSYTLHFSIGKNFYRVVRRVHRISWRSTQRWRHLFLLESISSQPINTHLCV
jgi:trehalose utilization protein